MTIAQYRQFVQAYTPRGLVVVTVMNVVIQLILLLLFPHAVVQWGCIGVTLLAYSMVAMQLIRSSPVLPSWTAQQRGDLMLLLSADARLLSWPLLIVVVIGIFSMVVPITALSVVARPLRFALFMLLIVLPLQRPLAALRLFHALRASFPA